MWTTSLALVAVTACDAGPTPAAAPSERPASGTQQRLLEEELEWLVAGEHAPGAVGAIITPDGTATAAVGDASLEPVRAMSPAEPVPTGSITKTFTAVVVLQLVADGHLALDDPVEAWLPGSLPGGERITVEHLLAHRSGVVDGDDRPVDEQLAASATEPCTARSAAEILGSAVAVPTSPPGANFRYANVGYVALGMLIEAVTGRSYEDELRRRVFEPLGLTSAGFLQPSEAADDGVRGYLMPPLVPEADGPIEVTCVSFAGGAALAAGGLVASVSDVAAFFAALLAGRLVQPEQLQLMQRAHSRGYGLGLELFDGTPCGPLRGHDGLLPGFTARAFARPGGDVTVVLVTNGVGRWRRRSPVDEAAGRLVCVPSR